MDVVTVNIVRNAHSTPRTVLEFEVPLLEQIFGPENVQEVERKDAGKNEVAELLQRPKITEEEGGKETYDNSQSDAELAWGLLQRRYQNSKDGMEALNALYPNEGMFKRMFAAATNPAPAAQKTKAA